MRDQIAAFWADESGAATVDWVVLTAASVGLGVAVMGEIRDGVEDLSREVDTFLRSDIISTSFPEPVVEDDNG
jgi:Flp pilus assembly pilin Flp